MRKQFLCAMSLALVLSGCSQAFTTIQSGDEEIMTIGKTTYTKADEYNYQKKSNGPTNVVQLALNEIYEKEIGLDDAMKKEAQEQVKESQDSVENFEKQVKSLGYKDIEDYTNRVAIPSVQSKRLIEKYMKDNKKEVKKQFKPSLAYIIECDNEDNAKKALKALKEKKDLNEVREQFGKTDSMITSDVQFVSTNSQDLPTRLINTLSSSKDKGVVDEVFSNDNPDQPAFYVAVLESNDYDKNLKQFAKNLSDNSSLSEDCLIFYLDKYKFEVHDQDLFDYFKANNPNYLVTRPDLATK